jgi:hypothetical protein
MLLKNQHLHHRKGTHTVSGPDHIAYGRQVIGCPSDDPTKHGIAEASFKKDRREHRRIASLLGEGQRS